MKITNNEIQNDYLDNLIKLNLLFQSFNVLYIKKVARFENFNVFRT